MNPKVIKKLYPVIKFFIIFSIINSSYAMFWDNAEVPEQFKRSLKKVVLATHNHFRQIHHAPDLVWDDQLAHFAQQYANKCRFRHSHHHGSGENIAAHYPSLTAAIDAWYNENKYYSYWRPGFSHDTGHFTQLVWKSSKRIGCGYAICNGKHGTNGNFLVCEYSPPGNMITRSAFIKNVLRP